MSRVKVDWKSHSSERARKHLRDKDLKMLYFGHLAKSYSSIIDLVGLPWWSISKAGGHVFDPWIEN